MEERFEPILLDEAKIFLKSIENNASEKILYNIRKSQIFNDPELFKKIADEIWEFRTLYNRMHYRLFSFWDTRNNRKTLVITTHGIIKKTKKTPKKEINKAIEIMKKYFAETE